MDQGKVTPMTQEAASRIQSAEARSHDGIVAKGTFASRAQSAAAGNASQAHATGTGQKGSTAQSGAAKIASSGGQKGSTAPSAAAKVSSGGQGAKGTAGGKGGGGGKK